jgi:magnesium chelatase subunit I
MGTVKNLNNFPFAAIIGQEEMKLALQLNVIDPKIGGVMIMGDRGTGKSTTIRALADLLPDITIIKNDPFNTDPKGLANSNQYETEEIKIPMVELPLGATEDRVCGTINLKEVLSGGSSTFEPGLLARANRGILYVDEVNLLDDHLVDVLLDSAASGWNTVEREGISIKHPAKFILVGSGNPEEGELRPQLLDRFGMHAEIRTIRDPNLRVKIVEERISFDQSPQEWFEKYESEQFVIQNRIISAQNSLI